MCTPADGIASALEVLHSVDVSITVDKSKKPPKRLRSSNVPPAPINVAEESAIVDIDDSGLPPPDQTVSETRESYLRRQFYTYSLIFQLQS